MLGALSGPALAEAPPEQIPPRLLEDVQPTYPPEALHAPASAEVAVELQIDTLGAVLSARVLSGPEVFAPAALAAAARMRFAPALLGGAPVSSTLVVHFHFTPPEPELHEGEDSDADIEIVVESDVDREDTHARTTLDEATLDRSAGSDLASQVSQIPGVTLASTSAATAKPIIRGQSERRLLILYDSVRHESQKWGPDHAPEIDPFSAGQISVIKGAAGVRYGPNAIGGVILVEPPPLLEEPGADIKTLWSGASNGLRGYGAARIDLAPEVAPGLTLRAEGDLSRSASLRAPGYVLGNTASQIWNAGGVVGYHKDTLSIRATYHRYDLRAGVFYGVSQHTPSDFLAALEREEPLTADLWTTTYRIDRPYQAVSHDLASLHVDRKVGRAGSVEAVYAFQLNHRREYEQVRESVEGPQYDFVLHTHSLDLRFEHSAIAIGSGAQLSGGGGLSSSLQENVYAGLPLLPNFRALGAGLYGYERLSGDRAALEAGLRYDALSRVAFLTQSAYDRHVSRGTLSAGSCGTGDVARCPSRYGALSVSLGGLWEVADDTLDLKLDLSSASRPPNADELYLNGSAPTFPVYALGDPSLRTENTWGASPTIVLRRPWLIGELSVYSNLVDRYIYFAPELTADRQPVFDVTIQGSFPRFGFRPVSALFYGADGGLTLGPTGPVGLDLSGAVVRARDTETGDLLVGIPSDRARAALVARPHGLSRLRETELSVVVEAVARNRVDPSLDIAPPPPGYVLLGVSARSELPMRRNTLRFGIDLANIGDTKYREYTSLLRYYADQPGRDLKLWIGADLPPKARP